MHTDTTEWGETPILLGAEKNLRLTGSKSTLECGGVPQWLLTLLIRRYGFALWVRVYWGSVVTWIPYSQRGQILSDAAFEGDTVKLVSDCAIDFFKCCVLPVLPLAECPDRATCFWHPHRFT